MNQDSSIRPTSGAETVRSIPGAGRGLQRPGSTHGSEQSRATGSPARNEASVGTAKDPWQADLPLSIAKDERLGLAEWAWRRVISAFVSEQTQLGATPRGTTNTQTDGQYAPAVNRLWDLMDKVATASEQVPSMMPLSHPDPELASVPDARLIPFSALQQLPESWSVRVKALALKDRLVSATVGHGEPHLGEGLFYPWLEPSQAESVGRGASEKPPASLWRATRYSQENADGTRVHRLNITFTLDDSPVECALIARHPMVSVHIRTNHPDVHRFCQSDLPIRSVLTQLGWSLDGWSLGDIVEET